MWLLFLIFISLFFSISIVGFSLYYGISPMPTSVKAASIIISNLSGIERNIYDLGSGFGSLAIKMAKELPQSHVYAYEISFFPWLISICMKYLLRLSNLEIYRKDFFKVSLQEAEVVVCYLYPAAMEKLKLKFIKELPENAEIITNCFKIFGWTPNKVIKVGDLWGSEIFIYNKSG